MKDFNWTISVRVERLEVSAKFEVLSAVIVKIAVFWNVMPCSLSARLHGVIFLKPLIFRVQGPRYQMSKFLDIHLLPVRLKLYY
jgi:hypothetical protein